MATELLSPLLPQRQRGLAVVVAAPLLALLLAVVIFSRSPVATPVSMTSPELVDLTLLAGAREKGAVCLDGSPPGYHLRRGFGSGAHSWLVFLEGHLVRSYGPVVYKPLIRGDWSAFIK